jgi:hypothetical protein
MAHVFVGEGVEGAILVAKALLAETLETELTALLIASIIKEERFSRRQIYDTGFQQGVLAAMAAFKDGRIQCVKPGDN